jgi:hypothetical protein
VNRVSQRRVVKVRRNELCPCGGDKKYKDCHESEGSAFLERLAREADREHLREMRKNLKERGVPWYRRLFYRS